MFFYLMLLVRMKKYAPLKNYTSPDTRKISKHNSIARLAMNSHISRPHNLFQQTSNIPACGDQSCVQIIVNYKIYEMVVEIVFIYLIEIVYQYQFQS